MKKRWISIIFTGLILVLSLSMAVGICIVGPAEAGANEVLAGEPKLTDKDGKWNTKLLSDVSDWFGDHFFLRQELISVNNWLFSGVFHTSDAEDVILGKEGWLYYASTLSDYTGSESMTEREIFCAARNLELMAECCTSQGRQFLFMIAPNKNSLYPQYMPNYGVIAEVRNANRLYAQLDERNVPYLDLFELFEEEDEILYFAHDSHWNSKGAALAADAINAVFDKKSAYYDADFTGQRSHAGDLYEMLYPAFQDSEMDPVYGGTLEFEYGQGGTQPDSITINTTSDEEGSLLVYRDSFGNLLYSYLADSFGQARFSRSTNYDLTVEGDCVLIELVERNLNYLITNIPVMPAPMRDASLLEAGEIISDYAGGDTFELQSTADRMPEGMMQIQGAVPMDLDDTSPIYVVCGEDVYEAFCLENNQFSALLPEDAVPERIACYVEGMLQILEM